MTRRAVVLLVIVVVCLHAISAECFAFWWPFKKKKNESSVLSQASYAISSIEYRPDYGDAVRVEDSDNEFVICGTCLKPTTLERALKPVPIVLKLTAPASRMTVLSIHELPSQPVERPPVSVSTAETSMAEGKGAPWSPLPAVKAVAGPKTDEQPACPDMSVYFDFGSSRIKDEDRLRIEDFAKNLTGKTGVLVKGYTCDIGAKKFNDRLAMDRARAVASILKKNGTTPVTVSGEGKCCYVSEDRALNRRVEILCANVR